MVKGEYPMFVKGHNRNQGLCPYGHVKDKIDHRGHKFCSRCQQAHHQSRRGNITFEEALARPENCEICGAHESEVHWKAMTIDHCHGSGKFRGWLCFNCNRGLQIFQDSPGLLRQAAQYLEEKGMPRSVNRRIAKKPEGSRAPDRNRSKPRCLARDASNHQCALNLGHEGGHKKRKDHR